MSFRFYSILVHRTYVVARRGFERVVIVITNHSHDDSGDLYIGPDACATVDEVST